MFHLNYYQINRKNKCYKLLSQKYSTLTNYFQRNIPNITKQMLPLQTTIQAIIRELT